MGSFGRLDYDMQRYLWSVYATYSKITTKSVPLSKQISTNINAFDEIFRAACWLGFGA